MVYHWRMIAKLPAMALTALLFSAAAGAQEFDPGTPTATPPDERQVEEREQVQKLRRAREELEMRRDEQARRHEGEYVRQMEMRRLQETRSMPSPRESYLGHETYWTQRERDSLQWKDPTDLSSMARRSTLEHQMYQQRIELDRAGTLRQGVVGPGNLNGIQVR